MRQRKFRTLQALRLYNRLVKKEYKITTKSGYESLKEDIFNSYCAGNRHIEIRHFYTKDNCTHTIDF